MPPLTFQINAEYAKITEVVRGLFVSGVCALSPLIVNHYRINAIINTTEEVPNVKSLGDIRYAKLWIEDNEQFNIYPLLELQSNQIHEILTGGGRVLVHSVRGVSRSAAICLAYLTKFRCNTLKDAYEKLAAARPMVTPNIGFWRQLIAFEQAVKQTHGSVRIVRDEAEPTKLVPDVYTQNTISVAVKLASQSFSTATRPENAAPKSAKILYENVSPMQKRTDAVEGRKRGNIPARKYSSPSGKFEPVLETLYEILEAAA
uniref:Tyrosine-protein phosphatase domain-containing protein n=1 Tax=Parascaris univalens TaxID=6257 RepID=A0A915AAY0_PARUN